MGTLPVASLCSHRLGRSCHHPGHGLPHTDMSALRTCAFSCRSAGGGTLRSGPALSSSRRAWRPYGRRLSRTSPCGGGRQVCCPSFARARAEAHQCCCGSQAPLRPRSCLRLGRRIVPSDVRCAQSRRPPLAPPRTAWPACPSRPDQPWACAACPAPLPRLPPPCKCLKSRGSLPSLCANASPLFPRLLCEACHARFSKNSARVLHSAPSCNFLGLSPPTNGMARRCSFPSASPLSLCSTGHSARPACVLHVC